MQSMLDSPDLEKEKPVLTGFAEMMECGVSHVSSNKDWPRIEEVLNERLGEAIYGDKSASDALDEAAAEAEKIIGA
ncbi:MAG: hypothetical protein GEU94_02490 [Micromonosporaceae bacterium]|nr:hypothetical protein [Micromonosporaceae bacterium]